jgi:hypothetical protein
MRTFALPSDTTTGLSLVKPSLTKIGITLATLAILIGGTYYLYSKQIFKSPSVNNPLSQVATQNQKIEINKNFALPLTTSTNTKDKTTLKPLNVTLQGAQLTNKIYVAQKPQVARDGTKYLMINMLLENENAKELDLRSRDLIRLVDPNGKKFAPSYFNKSTSLQPTAVKKDVIGFLVPESIKQFTIQYGLPSQDKQTIDLNFK